MTTSGKEGAETGATKFFEQRVARRWTRLPRSFASSLL